MSLASQHAAVKSWIRSVTGYGIGHVIMRNAGGPRPSEPYAVFDSPVMSERVGSRFVSSESVDTGVLTRTHTQVIMVRIGVDVMSPLGAQVLDTLELSTGTFAERARLADADLAFVRRSSAIYVPSYSDTDPRHRYRADFYFYSQIDLTETDYEMQSVTAEITAVAPDDSENTGDIVVGEE